MPKNLPWEQEASATHSRTAVSRRPEFWQDDEVRSGTHETRDAQPALLELAHQAYSASRVTLDSWRLPGREGSPEARSQP